MKIRYASVVSALAIGFGLLLVPRTDALAQEEGLCCQYADGGALIDCPVETQAECDPGAGVNSVWLPAPFTVCDLGSLNPGSCSLQDPTLPVELSSFEAFSNADASVTLRWETASELNNSGFDVEIGVGTDMFERIAFVEGHGTTNEPKTYSYVVNDLDPGTHLFRLKQIDFDGAFEYSSVVEAMLEVPAGFVLEEAYPNPFNPTTTIRFAVDSEQQVYLALYDAAGRETKTLFEGVAAADQMHSVAIDGSGLASGTYHVRLSGEGFSTTKTVTLSK